MTRRDLLFLAGAATLAPRAGAATGAPLKSKMGIATTSYMTVGKPGDTFEFLEQCHALGAGGVQSPLTSIEPEYLKRLRARAEKLEMYLEVMLGLPSDDTPAFSQHVAAAKEAGALCIRTACLNGRRYETFASLDEWRKFVADSNGKIDRALPIVEKARLPLAVENHKDWTVDELSELMKKRSSEYLGVCMDFGNNVALLDEPSAVLRLAPYAFSTHVKDMAVEPYPDGFLLSEVTLGEGELDLKKMVNTVRQHRPTTRFTLEMITRAPLQIPCLTDRYWATFPDRSGQYLARTLNWVGKSSARLQSLPRIDAQSKEAQGRLENQNVEICLHYAREELDL